MNKEVKTLPFAHLLVAFKQLVSLHEVLVFELLLK